MYFVVIIFSNYFDFCCFRAMTLSLLRLVVRVKSSPLITNKYAFYVGRLKTLLYSCDKLKLHKSVGVFCAESEKGVRRDGDVLCGTWRGVAGLYTDKCIQCYRSVSDVSS